MAEVVGVKAVIAALKARAAKRVKGVQGTTVSVGFQTAYALVVHERLDVHHPVGQAKFLEEPARTKAGEIAKVAEKAYRAGRPMADALYLAGLYLQREAMKRVPVDTGALKNSAFTTRE
jgi:hypothetical protein